jgi:hypothetical protein
VLEYNLYSLSNNRNLIHNTAPYVTAINAGLQSGETVNANHWIVKENVKQMEGAEVPPSLTLTQPNIVIQEVQQTQQRLREHAGTSVGRPVSAFKTSGDIPSGVALTIERSSLTAKRKMHISALQDFEQHLFERVRELVAEAGYPAKLDGDIYVDFSEIQMPVEPEKELDYMMQKVDKNILSIADVIRYYDVEVDSDDEAMEKLRKNMQLNAQAKSRGLFGTLLETIGAGKAEPRTQDLIGTN